MFSQAITSRPRVLGIDINGIPWAIKDICSVMAQQVKENAEMMQAALSRLVDRKRNSENG